MSGRVIVVGSLNVDLVLSVKRLPGPGETVTGGRFARHDGGKGGNQAVAAARLGAATLFVGAVGDDDFGTDAKVALEAEGVDASELVTIPGESTGVALIMVDGRGENLIGVASGANAALTADHVADAFERIRPGPGDVTLVVHEIPTGSAREALRRARAGGAATIFNPAPPDGLDRSTTGLADVLTPNRQELTALLRTEGARLGRPAGIDDPVAGARALLTPNPEGPGPGAVLVSLGASGAVLVATGGEPVDLPAGHVQAVDSTGAGDALNGALATGLAEGRPIDQAAARAVHAASLSTTRAGARPGMPTADELEEAFDRD